MPTKLQPPFKYSSLLDYTSSLADETKVDTAITIVDADKQFATSTLPGVQIMKKVRKTIGSSVLTMQQQFEVLWMVYVEQTRALGWTWFPGQSERGSRL